LQSRSPQISSRTPCACGSERLYAECCGVWHAGLATCAYAPSPEALMRSRYSAYVLGLIEYLQATWHPSTAPGDLDLPPVKWLGLEVRSAEEDGDAGVVEFVARCRVSGRAQRLHEISRFVRMQGRWYYIDGQMIDEADRDAH
jgi:SEC-C motif-containing protein